MTDLEYVQRSIYASLNHDHRVTGTDLHKDGRIDVRLTNGELFTVTITEVPRG